MGVCQSKVNNCQIVDENSIVAHRKSNQDLMLKKDEELMEENHNNNYPNVSILKLKSAPPVPDSQAIHHIDAKVGTSDGLLSAATPNSKTKEKLCFKAYAKNGVVFVKIMNYADIESRRMDMDRDATFYDGYARDEYSIQYKLPSKSQWDSITLTSISSGFYNGSFRFRLPVKLYSFEIKLKIKCDINCYKWSSRLQDYYFREGECKGSKTVRLKVKPYSFDESLKEIRSNDMMRVRRETRERANRSQQLTILRNKFDGIVFETFSMGAALKCMVGKVDHHSAKGDIIKGINTGLKRVFTSKSERYLIGFQIFKYCEVPDYDYYIQCISSKSYVELTYAWNEYLALGPKLYAKDRSEYKNGYHPQKLLFDTYSKESIFKCHICETRIKWFDYIFVCGCNEDDECGSHRYCVLCLYIISLQYQKLNGCLMEILDESINKYLIDEIVSFCLGECKVKQLKLT